MPLTMSHRNKKQNKTKTNKQTKKSISHFLFCFVQLLVCCLFSVLLTFPMKVFFVLFLFCFLFFSPSTLVNNYCIKWVMNINLSQILYHFLPSLQLWLIALHVLVLLTFEQWHRQGLPGWATRPLGEPK